MLNHFSVVENEKTYTFSRKFFGEKPPSISLSELYVLICSLKTDMDIAQDRRFIINDSLVGNIEVEITEFKEEVLEYHGNSEIDKHFSLHVEMVKDLASVDEDTFFVTWELRDKDAV